MKTDLHSGIQLTALALSWALVGTLRAENSPIPFANVGEKATADYQGDGLTVAAAPEGARLRCVFQKLEGKVTSDGLWLTSTADDSQGERFRVVAGVVGRLAGRPASARALTSALLPAMPELAGTFALPRAGTVEVVEQVARLLRPGLTEEYSVSVDGVRQDFVVWDRPAGMGDLRVGLMLSGARAEAAAYGVRLTLAGSGRELAYSRLRATDATGRELKARLVVNDAIAPPSATTLAVVVDDAEAVYPVRIDPTFSDADWVSLNPSYPGADGYVYALAVEETGNVYIGGGFQVVRNVRANHIAKWDGSTWSALGSGINEEVHVPGTHRNEPLRRRSLHRGRRSDGLQYRTMGRERLVVLELGGERSCPGAGVERKHAVCGRILQLGGRGSGNEHCQMGRQHLVGFGPRGKRLGRSTGSEWDQCLRRGRLHDGRRGAGEPRRPMERQHLVGFGPRGKRHGRSTGGERDQCLRRGILYDGRRGVGEPRRPMERQRLVGPGRRGQQLGQRAGGERNDTLRRRALLHGRRGAGELYRQVEWQRLVGTEFWGERCRVRVGGERGRPVCSGRVFHGGRRES